MSSLWALYALTSSPIMRAWPKPKGHQASNNGFTYWLYPRVQLSGFWKISPYIFIRYGQNIWRRWRVWRLGQLEKQKHEGERLKNSRNSEGVMSSGLSLPSWLACRLVKWEGREKKNTLALRAPKVHHTSPVSLEKWFTLEELTSPAVSCKPAIFSAACIFFFFGPF